MAEVYYIPEAGDVVAGRYEILREIGRGGFGVVYVARQLGIDREVAFKTLLPQVAIAPGPLDRFEREAQLIKDLVHPNTIRIYDFGRTDDGLMFLSMELLKGETLQQVLARGPLSELRTYRITKQILKALVEAHRSGIVHRDLKPENVMLVEICGEEDFVKVLDFGIAKLVGPSGEGMERLTKTGLAVGTPSYMAPELVIGKDIGPWSDLYAVGLMMVEMLTGQSAVDGTNTMQILLFQAGPEPIPLPPAIEAGPFAEVIRGAIHKGPHERFQSADGFLAALRQTKPNLPVVSEAERATVASDAAVVIAGQPVQAGVADEPCDAVTSDANETVVASVRPLAVADEAAVEASLPPPEDEGRPTEIAPTRPIGVTTRIALAPTTRERGRRALAGVSLAIALVAIVGLILLWLRPGADDSATGTQPRSADRGKADVEPDQVAAAPLAPAPLKAKEAVSTQTTLPAAAPAPASTSTSAPVAAHLEAPPAKPLEAPSPKPLEAPPAPAAPPPTSDPVPPAGDPPESPPAVEAATVTITIRSRPTEAKVYSARHLLGVTPHTISLASDSPPVALTLSKSGYYSKQLVITPDRTEYDVVLKWKRVQRRRDDDDDRGDRGRGKGKGKKKGHKKKKKNKGKGRDK